MSDDATRDNLEAASRGRPSLAPLPRLRIHHIMLWTAITAGWMTFARLVVDSLPEQSRGVQVNLLAVAIGYGAVTAVAGLGVYWWIRGMAFFTQPGHWIASWLMLSILWSVVTNLLLYWRLQSSNGNQLTYLDENWLLWLWFNPWAALIVVVPCMVFLAIRAADTVAWRVFFIGWAISKCLPDFLPATDWVGRLVSPRTFQRWSMTLLVLPLVLLAVAAWDDVRRRHWVPRHWSHWAGVLVCGALMASTLFSLLLSWLTR